MHHTVTVGTDQRHVFQSRLRPECHLRDRNGMVTLDVAFTSIAIPRGEVEGAHVTMQGQPNGDHLPLLRSHELCVSFPRAVQAERYSALLELGLFVF